MKTKLRALVGGVALLLVLAACYPGISSQGSLAFDRQATITKGKVNLTHPLGGIDGVIDPDGLQGPYDFDKISYAGNGTASVDLSFSQSKGNWNVTGKWIDGPVRMEFSGQSEYLSALLNFCLSDVVMYDYDDGIIGAPNIDNEWYPYASDDDQYFWSNCFDVFEGKPAPGYVEDIATTNWIKGGCIYIPTLYRSLNPAIVGTGHALILVCQNGEGTLPALGTPLTLPWEYPSYIEVWVPDTTNIDRQAIGDIYVSAESNEEINSEDEYYLNIDFEDNVYYGRNYFQTDNSPFRNYYAGGVNTNRSGKWIVQARVNMFAEEPLPTESPLFSSYYWSIP